MKKLLSYILILIVLVEIFIPASVVYAEDLGTCTLKANLDGTIAKLTGETETHCHEMANDPANASTFISWIKNTVPPPAPTPTPTPTNTNYQLLAPLPCTGGPGCDSATGTLTTFDPTKKEGGDLGGYLNLMIKLFIGICAVLAVVMIVIGGIEYMTSELPGNKEHGKERIMHAIFGLLLALGAYTLLNTINPDLLKTDLKSLADVKVNVTLANDSVAQTPTKNASGQLVYPNGAIGGTPLTGASAVLPNGVTVNHGGVECTTYGQSNCTSTKGLDISAVNTTEANCKCQLVITGGTESWAHGGSTGNTDHKPGSATVDLSATPGLNTFLSGSSSFPGGRYIKDPKGSDICYWAEPAGSTTKTTGDHWHVYYTDSCGG